MFVSAEQEQSLLSRHNGCHKFHGAHYEDKFTNIHSTPHRKLANINTATFVPISQRVDTTLQYHRDLGHTRGQNLYGFLKVRCWWSSMRTNIEEVLQKCKICEKFSSTHAPPKSVIPVTVKEPVRTWAIDVVGPMSTAKNNLRCKKYINTTVKYITRWTVAQAVVHHTGNGIRRFNDKEILSSFGPSSSSSQTADRNSSPKLPSFNWLNRALVGA